MPRKIRTLDWTSRPTPPRIPVGQPSRRQVLAGAAGLAGLATVPATARAAGEPIKIGIIAETSTLPGAAIPKGAQLAADAINKAGGVGGRQIQLIVYDDHVSAVEGVRAFQRLATQDKVAVVIASFISEVALAIEPWSARLKMPFITPGAASNDISKRVHDDYARYKYTFHGWFTSYFIADVIADAAHDILVNDLHMKSCVVMSEDAAWTSPLDDAYLKFLPQAGLKVLDHIRFSPDTTDFTPIFNRIEGKKPDVIVAGISHVGVVPTVQWKQQRVPIPMWGNSSQATSSDFWKDTNGACEGIATFTGAGPDSAITPKTIPFTQAYEKRYGLTPAYDGYSSYDMVHVVAEAITRAGGSTDPDKLVTALEATDHAGTLGRIKFYGRDAPFTHAMEYGLDLVPGVIIQWQSAKQLTIWPKKIATAKVRFPSFVKLPS
ncbi:MAG TPA: ABC transporter substrate-binding protein [Acetobacteraceae bacterium]|nr:ABC transporter substrate-binding protein [Acetobacteraceae bacterium]